VITANDGQEAVDKISASEFDLVLLDLQMPIMDGRTSMLAIKAKKDALSRIPFLVALTANADTVGRCQRRTSETTPCWLMKAKRDSTTCLQSTRETCLSQGFDAFLGKPLSVLDLGKVLQDAYQAKQCNTS
jgi:CheY-like chemotaxis protein